MALHPASPAINAAVGSTLTRDQRGFPIINTPDLGAYEAAAPPFQITSFTRSGPNLFITFPSDVGSTYQIQRSSNLQTWQPTMENLSGTGFPIALRVDYSSSSGFFRVSK